MERYVPSGIAKYFIKWFFIFLMVVFAGMLLFFGVIADKNMHVRKESREEIEFDVD